MTPQNQKAGEGSQQLQISGDVVINQGINEERAREIAREVSKHELEQFSAEAELIGSRRINDFHSKLVDMFASNQQLGAFSDPAFQVLLRKAQLGAASTDRDSDYDLLVDLLDDRVKRGQDRHVRAGLDQAVQIVDQVDDSALRGLTVLQACQQFSPLHPGLDDGLDTMEKLMAQLMADPLPIGNDWMEHLDVLGAVRVMPAGMANFKEFDDWYPTLMPGYVSAGILKYSEEAARVDRALAEVGLYMPGIEHELRPGWERLPFPGSKALELALIQAPSFPQEQISSALQIARDEYAIDQVLPELTGPFIERLCERPSLAALRTWWKQLPTGATITSVGRVLATANAKRLDALGVLPPLE